MKQHLPQTGIVPSQQNGGKTSIEAHVEANSREEAMEIYKEARRRLLDINRWNQYAGMKGAAFWLTDASGHPVDHLPEMGELICIKHPGTDQYDWVMIEEYIETIDRRRDNDLFALRVRPAKAPNSTEETPAHFLTEEATSTFLIQRAGTKVTAAEKGRNEVPNTESEKFVDQVKNLVMGMNDETRDSVLQWEMLIAGILQK